MGCFTHHRPLGRQIKQGKKKNPNDIDQMPVHADILNALRIFTATHRQGDDKNGDHSADDVDAVQTGHKKVKGPKIIGQGRDAGGELMIVFEGFDA